MKAKELADKCILDIRNVIKKFGVYSYTDKGPSEVMDTDSYLMEFRKLSAEEARDSLLLICKYKHGAEFVGEMVMGLDTMPNEYFRVLMENETLSDLY